MKTVDDRPNAFALARPRPSSGTGRGRRISRPDLDELADYIPDERMRQAGWMLINHLERSRGRVARNHAIDRAILAYWPDCIRVTVDATGKLGIWRRSPASTHDPFPSESALEHALRVIEAVGAGRAAILSDEIARQSADVSSATNVRVLQALLDADQVHFEAVANAIRSFGEHAPEVPEWTRSKSDDDKAP